MKSKRKKLETSYREESCHANAEESSGIILIGPSGESQPAVHGSPVGLEPSVPTK